MRSQLNFLCSFSLFIYYALNIIDKGEKGMK